MNMNNYYFLREIFKLKNKIYVDKQLMEKFLKRIKSGQSLTKEGSEANHFCSFFLPVHLQTKSIYLGHHIKGDDWMPPGGHIKLKETPLQTVVREFYEELEHKLTGEKIELFDLTIKKINNPKHNCKVHYDFWYLVFTQKHNFIFSKREFYTAGWLEIAKAPKLMRHKDYKAVIGKLPKILFAQND